jgi:serine phosphatase RsbU (regulator of sigma subunit)
MLKQERDPLNAQDGMDIAICAIDMQNRTIRYSGANHGLILGRAGELIEYKAKPISLGGIIYEKQLANLTNPFQTEEIQYNSGDYLFLFSDGLYDQLGGPENKKFNKARFRELLRNVLRMNDSKQASALCESVFQNWRGSRSQTDDIMLIGAKLN